MPNTADQTGQSRLNPVPSHRDQPADHPSHRWPHQGDNARWRGGDSLRSSRDRLSLRAVMQQQLDTDGLPPLAPPTASDDERANAIVARMVARHGAPSIEDYRKVYEQSGVPWPGDEEIRRRHPVASPA